MIVSFDDDGTENIFNGVDSRAARRACPSQLWRIAVRKLTVLDAAAKLTDLRVPGGNHLEALKGDRKGQHAIRINKQYRVCFTWTDKGPAGVEITDYH